MKYRFVLALLVVLFLGLVSVISLKPATAATSAPRIDSLTNITVATSTYQSGHWMSIKGAQLQRSGFFVDKKKVPLANLIYSSGGGWEVKYRVQNLPAGQHSLYALDPIFGKSNVMGFRVVVPTPTIEVELVNTNASVYPNNPNIGAFSLTYNITARNADAYIDGDCRSGPMAGLGATFYSVINKGGPVANVTCWHSGGFSSSSPPSFYSFHVKKDTSRQFQLRINGEITSPNSSGLYYLKLRGISFAGGDQNGNLIFDADPLNFRTVAIPLSNTSTSTMPTTTPSISSVSIDGVTQGGVWPIGSQKTVTWTGSGFSKADILFCNRTTGKCYGGAMATANDGSQTVVMPATVPTGVGYVIVRKQSDGSVKGISGDFNITTSQANAGRGQLASVWEAMQNFLVRIAIGK